MTTAQRISLAVIGVGGVGRAVIKQLEIISSRLAKQPCRKDVRLIFAARSTKQIRDETYEGLSFSSVLEELDTVGSSTQTRAQTIDYLAKAPGRVILIDNTSDKALATDYPTFLQRGISIVTPNKKAFSDTQEIWDKTFAAAANGGGSADAGFLFHEATVGAGLPVLSTLRELVETGDEVLRIEGIFSGTMSFLFNSFMPVGTNGLSFSEAVLQAKELGYTEPDPRDDLNGQDVARKLVILARLSGLTVESTASFPVESLIPSELVQSSDSGAFLRDLPKFDNSMEEIKVKARQDNKYVRFVGVVDVVSKTIKVGMQEFDQNHPIAALKGSDNIMSFYTKRYNAAPLTIQGAGAGAEVTAMGVTGDVLKAIQALS